MDRLQELKLAIYEKEVAGEISTEDRDLLLEAAEEKYSSINEVEELTEESSLILDSYRVGELTMEEALDILLESDDAKAVKIIYIEDINDTIEEINEQCENIAEDFRKGNFIIAKTKLKIAIAKLKTLKKDISKCHIEAKKYQIDAAKLISGMYLGSLVGAIGGCITGLVVGAKKGIDDDIAAGTGGVIGMGVGTSLPVIKEQCNKLRFNLSKKYKIFKSTKDSDKLREEAYDYIDECIKALNFALKNVDNLKIQHKQNKLENKFSDLERKKRQIDNPFE